jgi:hypothetical protein
MDDGIIDIYCSTANVAIPIYKLSIQRFSFYHGDLKTQVEAGTTEEVDAIVKFHHFDSGAQW